MPSLLPWVFTSQDGMGFVLCFLLFLVVPLGPGYFMSILQIKLFVWHWLSVFIGIPGANHVLETSVINTMLYLLVGIYTPALIAFYILETEPTKE